MTALENPTDREQAVEYTLLAPCFSIFSSRFSKVSMLVFSLKLIVMVFLNVLKLTVLIAFS
ncbi:unnamed protein product [Periconia digitata]|uniref:Uncharacterized protein n=1 Tax=Periconia digitata TaxID=1303443 RepID=A0A9W4UKB5_9PLEO|nr:unnamed protein product [Periconia digitata]